jgi:hypothetical protein
MADLTITPAAVVVGTAAAASPVLVVAGVSIGLQANDLIAGIVGAVAAILWFDAVPSTGDSWRELLRTTRKRVGFALLSAVIAGYGCRVAAAIAIGLLASFMPPERLATLAEPLQTLCALVIGGGAQRLFRAVVDRGVRTAAGEAKKAEGGA